LPLLEYRGKVNRKTSVTTQTDNRSRLLRSNFVKLLEKVGGNSEAAQILKREEMQLSGVTPRIALISLHDSIKALQSMGLIRDVQQLSIPEKSTTENKEDVNIYELLLAYYGAREKGWERAEQDGFICHNYNYRKETNDLPAELCALIGQPILQQISFKDRADAQGNTRNCLGLRRDDGVGISIVSMEPICTISASGVGSTLLHASRTPGRLVTLPGITPADPEPFELDIHGGRDLLLFPKTGRTIELDLEIFGTPDSNLKTINYQPTSDLIIGTTWDEIVAFPSAQAI
jgi:hypothetical protein